MEVALRAANWMAGFYFFSDEQDDPTFWIEFLKLLFQHGTTSSTILNTRAAVAIISLQMPWAC
jgi:hypothetical protein